MTRLVLVVAALLALALPACSSTPPAAPSAAQSTTQDAPQTAVAAPTTPSGANGTITERGTLLKAVGQPAYTGCPPGATEPSRCTVEFTLDAVTPCSAAPVEGTQVARTLQWTVKTKPEFADTRLSDGQTLATDVVRFSVSDLSQVTPSGITRPIPAVAPDCIKSDRFPEGERLRPASTYRGEMGLVFAEPGGSLIFAPYFAQGGWEWPLT